MSTMKLVSLLVVGGLAAAEAGECNGRKGAEQGTAIWCSCNADMTKIVSETSCTEIGGGRNEVCMWDGAMCVPSSSDTGSALGGDSDDVSNTASDVVSDDAGEAEEGGLKAKIGGWFKKLKDKFAKSEPDEQANVDIPGTIPQSEKDGFSAKCQQSCTASPKANAELVFRMEEAAEKAELEAMGKAAMTAEGDAENLKQVAMKHATAHEAAKSRASNAKDAHQAAAAKASDASVAADIAKTDALLSAGALAKVEKEGEKERAEFDAIKAKTMEKVQTAEKAKEGHGLAWKVVQEKALAGDFSVELAEQNLDMAKGYKKLSDELEQAKEAHMATETAAEAAFTKHAEKLASAKADMDAKETSKKEALELLTGSKAEAAAASDMLEKENEAHAAAEDAMKVSAAQSAAQKQAALQKRQDHTKKLAETAKKSEERRTMLAQKVANCVVDCTRIVGDTYRSDPFVAEIVATIMKVADPCQDPALTPAGSEAYVRCTEGLDPGAMQSLAQLRGEGAATGALVETKSEKKKTKKKTKKAFMNNLRKQK